MELKRPAVELVSSYLDFLDEVAALGERVWPARPRQVLRTPKAREVGKLLLTCAPDNLASNRTIRANGGVLERTVLVERIGRETNLYWNALSPNDLPTSP